MERDHQERECGERNSAASEDVRLQLSPLLRLRDRRLASLRARVRSPVHGWNAADNPQRSPRDGSGSIPEDSDAAGRKCAQGAETTAALSAQKRNRRPPVPKGDQRLCRFRQQTLSYVEWM